MGSGYWILFWEGFGGGLVLINPQLHTEGKDLYGNPNNWFADSDKDKLSDKQIVEKHNLEQYGRYYKIIRD